MPVIPPPSRYSPTSPTRQPRPQTTQQVAPYKPTNRFKVPKPPSSVVTQQVAPYKPTALLKTINPPFKPALATAKFFSRLPKGGGATLAIILELFFPPPAGDNYYDRNPTNPMPLYKLHPPEPPQFIEPPNIPFNGGQSPVAYDVTFTTDNGDVRGPNTIGVYGPVQGIVYSTTGPDPSQGGYSSKNIFIRAKDNVGKSKDYFVAGTSGPPFVLETTGKITKIVRQDSLPDTGGGPPLLNKPILSAPGNPLAPPVAAPPSAAPSLAPIAPPPFRSPSGVPQPKRVPDRLPDISPSRAPSDEPKRIPGGLPGGFPSPTPPPDPGPTPQPQNLHLAPAPPLLLMEIQAQHQDRA